MIETRVGGVLEREDVGGVTVVRVKEPLLRDDETVTDLFGRLYALLDKAGRRKLVLNLAAVEYLASVALGKLAVLRAKAGASGARLALCRVAPAVEGVLRATHLADVLSLYRDEHEAVRALA